MLLHHVSSLTYRKRYDRPAKKYSESKNAIKSWSLFIQVRCDTSSGVKRPALSGGTGDPRLKVQRAPRASSVSSLAGCWCFLLASPGAQGSVETLCPSVPKAWFVSWCFAPHKCKPAKSGGIWLCCSDLLFLPKVCEFSAGSGQTVLDFFISLRRDLWCFLCLGFGALGFGAVYQRVAISFRSVSALAFSISKSFRSWNTPVVKLHKS